MKADSSKRLLLNIAVAFLIGGSFLSNAAADPLPPAPTYVPGTRITASGELPDEAGSGKNANAVSPADPERLTGSASGEQVASGSGETSANEDGGLKRGTDLDALDPYIPAPGHWSLIPGSSILSALPTEAEFGAELCGQIKCHRALSVLTAWNALGYDQATHCLWALANGGHADYGGNETYRYCLGKPEDGWKRITDPAPLTGAAAPASPGCPTPATGPMASHTYDGVVWIPGTTKFLWLGYSRFCAHGRAVGGQAWVFDSRTAHWTELPGLARYAHFARTGIDPVSGNILVYTLDTLRAVDPNSFEVKWTAPPIADLRAGNAIVHPQRREFYLLAGGRIFSAKLDVPPGQIAVREVAEFPEINAQFGMAVHSPTGDIVMWNGRRTLYAYDPAHNSLKTLPPATGPAPSESNKGRVYSQWIYLPEKDLFVGISPHEGVWIWRPGPDLFGGPAEGATRTQIALARGPSDGQAAVSGVEATSTPPPTVAALAQAQRPAATGSSDQLAEAGQQDTTSGPPANTSLADLCARPETLLCDPLDDTPISGPAIGPGTKNLTISDAIAKGRYGDWRWPWGNKPGRIQPQLDPTMGDGGALKFTIPSRSYAGAVSLYTVDPSPDFSLGVAVGDTIRVRLKVRWSCDVLFTQCDPTKPDYQVERRHYATTKGHGGIKIFAIGEIDWGPGAGTMDSGEGIGATVLHNYQQQGFISAYIANWYAQVAARGAKIHGVQNWDLAPGGDQRCWMNDPGTGKKLLSAWPTCFMMRADQWVTLQEDLYFGGCSADVQAAPQSHMRLWGAYEGGPFQKIIDKDVNLRCSKQSAPVPKLGKIWLTPYNTGKDPTEVHPEGYVWYDSLWVAKIAH